MAGRTGVVVVSIAALGTAVGGFSVAVVVFIAANNGEIVPVYLPSLIVVALLATAALLGLATALRSRHRPRSR